MSGKLTPLIFTLCNCEGCFPDCHAESGETPKESGVKEEPGVPTPESGPDSIRWPGSGVPAEGAPIVMT